MTKNLPKYVNYWIHFNSQLTFIFSPFLISLEVLLKVPKCQVKCRELKPTELCAAGSADEFAVTKLHVSASVGTAGRTEVSHPTVSSSGGFSSHSETDLL